MTRRTTLPTTLRKAHIVPGLAMVAALAMPAWLGVQPAIAQGGPFAGMAGSWSGTGTIRLTSGANERIRCKVTYNVGQAGSSVQQELLCASDSYKFNLSSNIRAADGRLAGQWNETSRGAGGTVTGTVNAGNINGLVEGTGFSADFTVDTRGNNQSVKMRPRGIDVAEVNITLKR